MFFANAKGLASFDFVGGKKINGINYIGVHFAGRDLPWYTTRQALKGRVIDPEDAEDLSREEFDELVEQIMDDNSAQGQPTLETVESEEEEEV